MKIVAINGSPRKGGNTELLLKEVCKPLEAAGIDTQIYQLGGKPVHGCTACLKCRKEPMGKCHIKNDAINECIQLMSEADGILIGSPVYFSDVTTEIKALMDCAGYVLRKGENKLRRKVGSAVIAVRRTGGMHTYASINNWFLINEMFIAGSSYWPVGIGMKTGDVLEDEEGVKTMQVLGENMAWFLNQTGK